MCWSEQAVDRNGQAFFERNYPVKGAKRRLRRSKTLDDVDGPTPRHQSAKAWSLERHKGGTVHEAV
jgi:hypothetical protein